MITIISEYNDNTSLDTLATECNYEVTIHTSDGSTTSAICDGENPGEQAIDVVDRERLLRDNNDPFPTVTMFLYKIVGKFVPQHIGV